MTIPTLKAMMPIQPGQFDGCTDAVRVPQAAAQSLFDGLR